MLTFPLEKHLSLKKQFFHLLDFHQLQRELENNLLTLSAVTQPKGKKKKGKASCKVIMYCEH